VRRAGTAGHRERGRVVVNAMKAGMGRIVLKVGFLPFSLISSLAWAILGRFGGAIFIINLEVRYFYTL